MNILTGERVTVPPSPSKTCRESEDGEETELPIHETSPGLPTFKRGL